MSFMLGSMAQEATFLLDPESQDGALPSSVTGHQLGFSDLGVLVSACWPHQMIRTLRAGPGCFLVYLPALQVHGSNVQTWLLFTGFQWLTHVCDFISRLGYF